MSALLCLEETLTAQIHKTPLFQNRLSRQQKYLFDLGLWCTLSNQIKVENNCVHIFKYAAMNQYRAHTYFIILFISQ